MPFQVYMLQAISFSLGPRMLFHYRALASFRRHPLAQPSQAEGNQEFLWEVTVEDVPPHQARWHAVGFGAAKSRQNATDSAGFVVEGDRRAELVDVSSRSSVRLNGRL